MKEMLVAYVKRVRELAEHVKGNEQATKQSLIGPLLTLLGYDLTDPRECVPEFRVDFGKERSKQPIDWAFFQGGRPAIFVEAKEVGKRLAGYDEQLGDYFNKSTDVKLGILTNGLQWRFYTDLVNANVMDKEPFVKWDVLNDEQPPIEFLTVLQKSEYNPNLLRTFAQKAHQHNLLLGELTRLLEPSLEFTKMAIVNLETRNLTAAVVESWRPVLASAINEWARQRALTSVINHSSRPQTPAQAPIQPSVPPPVAEPAGAAKIETTKEELNMFAAIQRILGSERPVVYEDTASYFKIHLIDRKTKVVCRLYLGARRFAVWVPLTTERMQALAPSVSTSSPLSGWSLVNLASPSDIDMLADALRTTWDLLKTSKGRGLDIGESDT